MQGGGLKSLGGFVTVSDCVTRNRRRLWKSALKREADTPLHRIRRWQSGETPGPWTVTLLPTNRCNLHCPMCWQRHVDVDYAKELPDSRLEELVDEGAELGVRQWNISGGGEPMARGELVMNLCARIRGRGMNGVIQTNATMFSPEQLEQLTRIGWMRIVVSLEGPTPVTNDAVRGQGSFMKATGAARLLQTLKQEHGTEWPQISTYTVLTRWNFTQLEPMMELAHELGCVAAEVSLLIGDTEACNALRPPPDCQEELAIHVDRAVRRAESLGVEQNLITLLPNGARNGWTCPSGVVTGRRSDTDLSFAVCFEPWLSMTIFQDGRAGPCCVFWDYEADSVQHRSLRDVWVGPFLQRVRKDLRKGVAWRQCAQCLSITQVRNESFRERLRLHQMNLPRRAAVLARKAASSVKRHGLRRAAARALEWTRLGQKW